MNKIEITIKESFSRSEVCRKLGYHANGAGIKKVNKLIEEYDVDISHFNFKVATTIYKVIDKICPICGEIFKTKEGHTREKTTCSHSCSNSYFRSGENNPNYKDGKRVSVHKRKAFEKYGYNCQLCDFDKRYALEVHHKDLNHDNNNISNLRILCANCHSGVHYGGLECK